METQFLPQNVDPRHFVGAACEFGLRPYFEEAEGSIGTNVMPTRAVRSDPVRVLRRVKQFLCTVGSYVHAYAYACRADVCTNA